MQLTDEQWKERLSPEQYQVLRQKGTEPPFTGALLENHDKGIYKCAACGAELFKSDTKFESGSGWPSFYDVAKTGAVNLKTDESHGMQRVEATCGNCDGHLGHVFPDAFDKPTGQRFCINSASLEFKKED